MSNETDVLSGTQGSTIKVATTTDGSGNEVQHVHIPDTVNVSIVDHDTTLPVSVVGAVEVTTLDLTQQGVSLGALNDVLATSQPVRDVIIQIDAGLVGAIVAEMSVDGTTWLILGDLFLINVESGVGSALDVAGGMWVLNIDGRIEHFRLRCSTYTSGSAPVGFSCSAA